MEDANKKAVKVGTIIGLIISVIIALVIFVPMCSEDSDIKKCDCTYKEYVLGYDNTYIVVSYNLTNNSNKTRDYNIYVELTDNESGKVIAKGNLAMNMTIKSKSTKELAVVCKPTYEGNRLGYNKIYEKDLPNISTRISAIVIDGTVFS